ncbi:hypothetical protein BH23PLA1_BH23PLA1_38900 [soil metagenome]
MDNTPNITVEAAHHEHESHVRIYIKVFFALLFLTLAEYFYAYYLAEGSFLILVLGLVAMAFVKAGLVGVYFMHLKWEGRWVYLMLIPTCLLAAGLILALMPDIGMTAAVPDESLEDEFATAPLEPGAIFA